jgi:hypothetical protein
VVVGGEVAELMAQPGIPPHFVDGSILELEQVPHSSFELIHGSGHSCFPTQLNEETSSPRSKTEADM